MQQVFRSVGPFLQPIPAVKNGICYHYYSKSFGSMINSRQSKLLNEDVVGNAQCLPLPFVADLHMLQTSFNAINTEDVLNQLDLNSLLLQKYPNQYVTPLHLCMETFKMKSEPNNVIDWLSKLSLASDYMSYKSNIFAKTYDGHLYGHHYYPLYMIRDKSVTTTGTKLNAFQYSDRFNSIIAGIKCILINGYNKNPNLRIGWLPKPTEPLENNCSQEEIDLILSNLHDYLFGAVRCYDLVTAITNELYPQLKTMEFSRESKDLRNEIISQILRDYSLSHSIENRQFISPFFKKSNILDISGNTKDPVNVQKDANLNNLIAEYPENIASDHEQFDNYGFNAYDVVEEHRMDFTDNAFIIDPLTVHESDDAISVRETSDGYLITVHVADPAAVMTKEHPITKMAARKLSSLYLVDNTYPIIPSNILQNRLSLMSVDRQGMRSWSSPQKEINALSFQFKLNNDKSISNFKVFPTTLKSTVKLSYSALDVIFDQKYNIQRISNLWQSNNLNKYITPQTQSFNPDTFKIKEIFLLKRAADDLNKSLNLKMQSTIDVSTSSIKIQAPSHAMFLVQCFMVQCNKLAAKYAMDNKMDILYMKTDSEHLQNATEHSTIPGIHQHFQSVYTSVTSPLRKFTDIIYHYQFYAKNYDLHHYKFDREWLDRYSNYCNIHLKRIKTAGNRNREFWMKLILSQNKPQKFKISKSVQLDKVYYKIPLLGLKINIEGDYPDEFEAIYYPQPFEKLDKIKISN